MRHGFGLKAATITPEGAEDVGSPNALLREAIGGKVIIRTGRRLSGVRPVAGIHAPISVVRMAVDDAYNAREYREERATTTRSPGGWSASRGAPAGRWPSSPSSRRGACRPRSSAAPSGPSRPVYEGMLKEELDAAAERHPDVRYRPMLIDATYSALISHTGDALVVPALNRDGDCLSDMVLQLFGSIAGAESQLLAFDDDFQASAVMAEAPHGTAPTLQGKNVANPLAMILAAASVLPYMRDGHASAVSRAIYEGALETVAEDIRTADLGGQTGTEEFTDEVIKRVRTKLDVWAGPRRERAALLSGAPTSAPALTASVSGPSARNSSRSSTVKRPLCMDATSP